jgi:hypothetical protein
VLIVSFYTPDYAECADRLRTSCDAMGERYWIEEVDDVGSWVKNCARKGPFVSRALEAASEPVLWVDADAELCRPLEDLRALMTGYSFGIWKDDRMRSEKSYFRSGTAYFGQTEVAHRIARDWARHCEAEPTTWDQALLVRAWDAFKPPGVRWLPVTFCETINREGQPNSGTEHPHILHHQASRQFRKGKP